MKITENAKKEILKNGPFLKVIAQEGGCAGLQYHLEYANEQGNYLLIDEIILTTEEAKQFIEHINLDFLKELGYKEFKIENPIAKKTCGCGTSFAL